MTPFAWFRWARRVIVALILIVVIVVADVWIHIWWVARENDEPRSDAIIVLGASQYNGVPSPVFAARLAHAASLYEAGVAPKIVTVGGNQPGDAYTEARAGKIYLHQHGVPSTAILAVPTGSDTLTSLRAVAETFATHDWTRAVIVTDPWHCLRSRSMARYLGIKAVTSPERTGPAVGSTRVEVRYIARETEAYIYWKIFHNDSEHSAGVL